VTVVDGGGAQFFGRIGRHSRLRRCLVPMTSGYEWEFAGTKKSIAHAFGVMPKYSVLSGNTNQSNSRTVVCDMPILGQQLETNGWRSFRDLHGELIL